MASPGYIASCCMGNKSQDVPSDLYSTNIFLEEKVVSIVSLVFALGSCLGIVVILYPWRLKRSSKEQVDPLLGTVRQSTRGQSLAHVVKCLIIAGVLANVGLIVRSSVWIAGFYPSPEDAIYSDSPHVLCIVFTVWVQFFFLCVVFWHLVYGLETYMVCHMKTCPKPVQHFLGWGIPAMLCSLGVWVAYEPTISRCAASRSVHKGSLYLVLLLPVLVVLVLILGLFWKSSVAVKRSLIHQRGGFSTAERQVLDGIQVKFIMITVAFTVCWFPNLLNGVFVNTLDGRAEDLILVFLVLQAVLNPFEVLIDVMVLYGWPQGVWCLLLRARCHGYKTIPSTNVNNLGEVTKSARVSESRDGLLSFSRTASQTL